MRPMTMRHREEDGSVLLGVRLLAALRLLLAALRLLLAALVLEGVIIAKQNPRVGMRSGSSEMRSGCSEFVFPYSCVSYFESVVCMVGPLLSGEREGTRREVRTP